MVKELLPALVPLVIQMNMDHGVAFGLDRFLNEFHVGLLGSSSAFFYVALGAGADDIIPSAFAAEAPGNNMIQGQFRSGKLFTTVLAVVAVPGEKIAPIKLDSLSREPVIKQQANDPRYRQIKIDGRDPVLTNSLK